MVLVSLHCLADAVRVVKKSKAAGFEVGTVILNAQDLDLSGKQDKLLANNSGCGPKMDAVDAGDPVRDLKDRLMGFLGTITSGNFCRDPNEESAEEKYSDAMIEQSWAYCAHHLGNFNIRGPFVTLTARDRLGIKPGMNLETEGGNIFPYNQRAGRDLKASKEKAAGKIARTSGDFRWVGTLSAAFLGLIKQFDGVTPAGAVDTAVDEFVREEGGTFGAFEDLKKAFKGGRSHPSRILDEASVVDMMNKCVVPKTVQDKFRRYAVSLAYTGSE